MQIPRKPVILLVAEAVTLAHFARIAALAKAIDASAYSVVVASDPRYAALDSPPAYSFHPISSIPGTQFTQALARGEPLYSVETLARYVDDDLALIKNVRPDLIVGDFRLSLAVSAPVAGIPYAAVVNAYWSPYADIAYPVPDIPMTRMLGVPFAQRLFDLVRPAAFAIHARALNNVRRRHRLPSLGHDLRTVYSWGDYTLYADVPELIRMRPLPATHRFLGPPVWSARASLPDWWDRLPDGRPTVLLSFGTSGQSDLLSMALAALSDLPITVIAANPAKTALPKTPANAFVADYLPFDKAVRRSSLVICNGGSLTTYQSIACGVPVVGLCSNMDQLLNMNAIAALGAGSWLRAARVDARQLRNAVETLLEAPRYALAARQVGERFSQVDAGQRFREFVREAVG